MRASLECAFTDSRVCKATKEVGLRFVRGSGLRLSVSADANYAAATKDRRSVSGVAMMLGGTAIGWKSSTQKCVITATCEAEYVALCDAAKEAIFTRAVLTFLQPQLTGTCVDIFGDMMGLGRSRVTRAARREVSTST